MQFKHLLLVVALAAGGAHAQSTTSLPRPVEFYFDADAIATRPIVAVRDTGDAAAAKLIKAIGRNPQAKAENAHLGHLLMAGGQPELGREAYQRALARMTPGDSLYRPLLWNYAWDLYRTGDTVNALEQWSSLLKSRSINASWMPPTLALALWSVGRKDEAVRWYAAAVRSEPAQWRDTGRYVALLPEWRESERATLAEVQAAWAASPPAWP